MKRLLSLVLVLSLGALLVAGCNSTTSTIPSQLPNSSAVADAVGGLVSLGSQVDGTATGLLGVGISSAGVLNAMTVATDLVYDTGTGWWTFTYSYLTSSYTFKAKAYTVANAEIKTEGGLSDTNKLKIVCTLTIGSTITYNFGTDSSPLIFDGLQSGTKNMNGTISLSLTDSTGSSFSMTMVYTGVVLDSSGLPASGSISFTFTSSDYATVVATITFNGNGTATFAITEPTDIASNWTVDLLTGDATAASL